MSSNPNVIGSNNGLNITINALPIPVINGNTSVCLGATNVQYSVSPVSGHSYQWYQPIRGTIVSGTTSSSVFINWNIATGTEQLKMRQTNNTTGCFKDTVINVTIKKAKKFKIGLAFFRIFANSNMPMIRFEAIK